MSKTSRIESLKTWVWCQPLHRLPRPLWWLIGSPLLSWAMDKPVREWWKKPSR